jgi:2-(1,2-epoxy-1,2-dihydrophenyl)acetyl-CoA isomerase
MTKRMLTMGLTMSLSEALHQEAMAQAVTGASQDTAEALRAFFQKREPSFKGR